MSSGEARFNSGIAQAGILGTQLSRDTGTGGGQRPLNSLKYRSRDMPAVRMLLLMMSTPTSEYFGMMTGRTIPGLVRTTCESVVRSCVKPSASKIRTSVRQSAGANLLAGMFAAIVALRGTAVHDLPST